jgi:seryl-tRNA synthetase
VREDHAALEASCRSSITAHSPCFRSEAGSGGRDTRGMIRQHQFDKVEMVQIVTPDQSYDALEADGGPRRGHPAKARIALPQVMALCTGDMGFGATKTYDLEVWLPAQNTYREISLLQLRSLPGPPHAGALQERAGQERTGAHAERLGSGGGPHPGGVLENYQQADGSVVIPEALRPWMGGVERIRRMSGPPGAKTAHPVLHCAPLHDHEVPQ